MVTKSIKNNKIRCKEFTNINQDVNRCNLIL